jgi:hypothetical protein
MGGVVVLVGAIYGPNVDDKLFFNTLKEKIKSIPHDDAVQGGDWNAALDNRPARMNIDTLNMLDSLIER